MTTRTDIHRPTTLVTEDYEYLYSWDSKQPGALIGIAQSDAWREWHAAGPVLPEVSSSQCTHCGAHLRYVALLRYVPTGQYLYVGETCLDNRFALATAEFHKLRTTAKLDSKVQAAKAAWAKFVAEHGEINWDELNASTNPFVIDVLSKGPKYGLTERQINAIQNAVQKDKDRVALRAAQALIPTVPVPEGSGIVIEGTVLSTKWQESQFGSVHKFLISVETPAGNYKLWGSVPKDLEGTWGCVGCKSIGPVCTDACTQDFAHGYIGAFEVGDKVRFTANVTKSEKDEAFGFFSRPRKATIIAKVVA